LSGPNLASPLDGTTWGRSANGGEYLIFYDDSVTIYSHNSQGNPSVNKTLDYTLSGLSLVGGTNAVQGTLETTNGPLPSTQNIALVNFPNNATMKITLSNANANKSVFQAGIKAADSEAITNGNYLFKTIQIANSSGYTGGNWKGNGGHYTFINGGGAEYYYISKDPITFGSYMTVINFIPSEWTKVTENWNPSL
jgi:hypothetical protein